MAEPGKRRVNRRGQRQHRQCGPEVETVPPEEAEKRAGVVARRDAA